MFCLWYVLPVIITFYLSYKETKRTHAEPTIYNLLFEEGQILFILTPLLNWSFIFVLEIESIIEWSKKQKL